MLPLLPSFTHGDLKHSYRIVIGPYDNARPKRLIGDKLSKGIMGKRIINATAFTFPKCRKGEGRGRGGVLIL